MSETQQYYSTDEPFQNEPFQNEPTTSNVKYYVLIFVIIFTLIYIFKYPIIIFASIILTYYICSNSSNIGVIVDKIKSVV